MVSVTVSALVDSETEVSFAELSSFLSPHDANTQVIAVQAVNNANNLFTVLHQNYSAVVSETSSTVSTVSVSTSPEALSVETLSCKSFIKLSKSKGVNSSTLAR